MRSITSENKERQKGARPLRVLIVDDSAQDADLARVALNRGGFDVYLERVDTAEAMSAALDQGS